MDDLITWLRGQLDEDERVARAATPGPWRGGDWRATYGTPEVTVNAIERSPDHGPFPALRERDVESDLVLRVEDDGDEAFAANVAHIARHDPASVLADIAAKRALLDTYEGAARFYATRDNEGLPPGGRAEEFGLGQAVQIIASAYADRPGYREEWRP